MVFVWKQNTILLPKVITAVFKSHDDEDDDDGHDDDDVDDGFWKQNTNLLPKTMTSAVKVMIFDSKVHDSSLWQSDQEICLKSLK